MALSNGLIHKIANICKDYYILRTINDLFIFAGADPGIGPTTTMFDFDAGNQRFRWAMAWFDNVKQKTPQDYERVVKVIAEQLLDNLEIKGEDRAFLQRELGMIGNPPASVDITPVIPADHERLLEVLIKRLRRSMLPLKNRGHGKPDITFTDEYDLQTLFHALIRPWLKDIRPEDYVPSYAGKNTRIDFFLPEYEMFIELKIVRDKSHARNIGDELIIDIAHYQANPRCKKLWAAICDPDYSIPNPDGLVEDLQNGASAKQIKFRLFIV